MHLRRHETKHRQTATAIFLFYLLFPSTAILANVTTAIIAAPKTSEPICLNIHLYAVIKDPLLPLIP